MKRWSVDALTGGEARVHLGAHTTGDTGGSAETGTDGRDPRLAVSLRPAVVTLQDAGVIAYPTETFYGLGALPQYPEALARIYRAKGRGPGKPLLLLVDSPDMALGLSSAEPPLFAEVVDAFWPGPLTLLVPGRSDLPAAVRGGGGQVAVRMSSHQVALALVRECGAPVTATSANRAGHPAIRDPRVVMREFEGRIDGIVDTGLTSGGLASTLLDLTTDPPTVLRAGAVSTGSLARVVEIREGGALL